MKFINPTSQILLKYYQDPQTNLKIILSRFLNRYAGTEKNQITRTVYGVLRKDIALTHVIRRLANKKDRPPALETLVLLKIAAFLLLFSDSYPEYAVVDEIVRAAEQNSKAFINAVLRTLLRQKQDILKELDRSDTLKYALSPLLIQNLAMISRDIEKDLAYLDREPVFHLRFHPGQWSVEQARDLLKKNEIPFREIPALGCFETNSAVPAANKLDRLPGFYLQNTGSQAVALLAAAYAKKTVCDVTAAPGGKSMTLACLRPDLTIHASDIHEGRLRLLQNNLARLALKNIQAFTADVFNYPAGRETADLVVLDAPCSSSGTLRKNPDLKSKISKNLIKKNANCQLRMLERIFSIFPRATVIYAVCSFIHEESEGLVEKVAAKLNLQAAAIAPLLEKYTFQVEPKKFGCYLLPSELNNDLFYISLLQKRQ